MAIEDFLDRVKVGNPFEKMEITIAIYTYRLVACIEVSKTSKTKI